VDAVAATIAEHTPTPLSEFLSGLPGSWEMQLFYGLMLSGTLGMLAHYVLKWARDEIKGNLFCYWIVNGKKTLLSFLTFTGIAATAVMNNAFVTEYGGFVGWKLVLWMGWTNGLVIDVIVNRTDRARWSIHERQRKVGPRDI
jgi:hypothetical protein